MAFKMNPDGSLVPVENGENPSQNTGTANLNPAPQDNDLLAESVPPLTMQGTDTGDLIKESNAENFVQDVIETSMQVPVIVDFWAPWCGPCKQLGPALEKIVNQAGGLVRMVKVNVDENQELAAQLRVQSIPAVFAFKEGRPVDGFSGALPDSQIKSFVERLLGDAKSPLEQALDAAKEMLETGTPDKALEIYRQIQSEVPDNEHAIAGVIRSSLALGDRAYVDEVINELSAELRARPVISAAISAAELDLAAEDAGDIGPLREIVEAEPNNLEARFDLAMSLIASDRHDAAIDEFLELIGINRNWNEDAARLQLLKLFDTLGPTHDLTISGRKRLSRILFS